MVVANFPGICVCGCDDEEFEEGEEILYDSDNDGWSIAAHILPDWPL
jgi:hypothetical protein